MPNSRRRTMHCRHVAYSNVVELVRKDGKELCHADGWGSPAQAEAVATADRAVGTVLDALAATGLTEQTLVILTADHGGAGRNLAPDNPRRPTLAQALTCVRARPGPGMRPAGPETCHFGSTNSSLAACPIALLVQQFGRACVPARWKNR